MASLRKIGSHRTTVTHGDGVVRVTYHQTCVVEVRGGTITLRAGGWRTPTTKTRMNQAANQFDLRFRVVQEKGVWVVIISRVDESGPFFYQERRFFVEGMTFAREGGERL